MTDKPKLYLWSCMGKTDLFLGFPNEDGFITDPNGAEYETEYCQEIKPGETVRFLWSVDLTVSQPWKWDGKTSPDQMEKAAFETRNREDAFQDLFELGDVRTTHEIER